MGFCLRAVAVNRFDVLQALIEANDNDTNKVLKNSLFHGFKTKIWSALSCHIDRPITNTFLKGLTVVQQYMK